MRARSGGYEKQIHKDSWRRPGQVHQDYLNQFVTWGYTLSDVERIIIDTAG
jgi:ParB family transcriptional regulator, chromosome partitioning protein